MKYYIGLGLLSTLLLSACGSQSTEVASKANAEIDPSQGALILGRGFDAKTEDIKGDCIAFDGNPEEIIYTGQQSTTTTFERNMSYERAKSLLDVQVKGKLNYGLFNVKGAAQFVSETKSSDYRESLVFVSTTQGQSAELKNLSLSELGLRKRNTFDSEQIMQSCGNEFVRTVDLGSMLLYNVSFDFANKDVKSKFEASIDFDYAAIFSVSGAAKIVDERFRKQVGIRIYAMQVGGRSQDLPTILTEFEVSEADGKLKRTVKQDGVNIIDCQLTDEGGIEACQKVMKRMMQYASLEYPAQLTDMSYDIQNVADDGQSRAAVLKYRTTKYEDVGVDLFQTPVAPLEQAIIDARRRIEIRHQKLSQDYLRAEKIKDVRASEDERARIRSTYNIIKTNYDRLVDVAILCYEQPGRCIDAEQNYKQDPYDPESLSITMRFFDYCQLKSLYSRSVNDSLDIIAASMLYDISRDDCQDIEQDLEVQGLLDFTSTGIRDLRPLAKLSNLKQLYLGKNSIVNVAPLASIPTLEKVVLRENALTNPSALKHLDNLEYLDLSHNRLFEADSFADFSPSLKVLKLHGNQIRDFSALNPADYRFLYRDVEDICEYERSYLLDNGKISRQEYNFNRQLGFGPLYKTQQDSDGVYRGGNIRSDVFNWVNCVALDKVY